VHIRQEKWGVNCCCAQFGKAGNAGTKVKLGLNFSGYPQIQPLFGRMILSVGDKMKK
jgi:hypothetical protein